MAKTPYYVLKARRKERELQKALVFSYTPLGAVSGEYGESIRNKFKKEYEEAVQHRKNLEKLYGIKPKKSKKKLGDVA